MPGVRRKCWEAVQDHDWRFDVWRSRPKKVESSESNVQKPRCERRFHKQQDHALRREANIVTDTMTKARRSALMRRIKGDGTGPELALRAAARATGRRFRPNDRSLPGSPDAAFHGAGLAVFVHGCFWHAHKGCQKARIPKTRTAWWRRKLDANVRRDARAVRRLRAAGWRTMTVWECGLERGCARLARALNKRTKQGEGR